MKVESTSIARAVEIAIEDGNAVEEISDRWTKVRQAVLMKHGLSQATKQRIERELPSLRYWSADSTPHTQATEGFTADGDKVTLWFPVHAAKE